MRKMIIASLKALFVLLVINMAGANHLYQPCSSHSDCTLPNMYCYERRNCVSCTNCSIYNKLPNPNSNCAKNKDECGSCAPGMTIEYNLDKTFTCHSSDTLVPTTLPPSIQEPNSTNYVTTIIIFAAVILLAVLLVCGYCVCRNTNTCVIVRNRLRIIRLMSGGSGECFKQPPQDTPRPPPPPPPPYEETNPHSNPATAPPFENVFDSPERVYAKVIQSVENDPNQTANAFQCPTTYVRGGNLGTTNQEPGDPEEESEPAEDEALLNTTSISQDEETQPSTWTPTSGTETTGEIGRTSFAGALSMDNLRISQPNLTTTVATQQGPSNRSNSQPEFSFQNSPNSENSDSNIQVNITNLTRIDVRVCNRQQ